MFVLAISLVKEAYDDYQRWKRDAEANSTCYERMNPSGTFEVVPSSSLRVGDIIRLHGEQRVPADCLLLRTHDKNGSIFIRTDQLDGETDWKLRTAVTYTQRLPSDSSLTQMSAHIEAEAPHKEIYEFRGTFTNSRPDGSQEGIEALSLENTLWSNTVVANGVVIASVVYTGKETRSVLNANVPPSKFGLLDTEINNLAKVLFAITIIMACLLMLGKGFDGLWYIYFFRFILLLSSIIPISMRVNLDMGKTVYSYMMMRDDKIPGTVVRTSTIPEELGRVSYIFSDKTGTLTQNIMTFNTLQMAPPLAFTKDSLHLIRAHLTTALKHEREDDMFDSKDEDGEERKRNETSRKPLKRSGNGRKSSSSRRLDREREESAEVRRAVTCIALCHNVTPITDEDGSKVYQASSPDEIALVKFAESVGLGLQHRTEKSITLSLPGTAGEETYTILNVFPFTSESKRMGIIVQNDSSGRIWFVMKGAENVMSTKLNHPSDWLDEEVENLARVGLRTLVVAMKELSQEEYDVFARKYHSARTLIQNRDEEINSVVWGLEDGVELVGLTGVEDKLQEGVKEVLETLRNAGIKIWMLTGDKAETASCIGRSARLVDRSQELFYLIVKNKRDAARQLDLFGTKVNTGLVIDGYSLVLCLTNFQQEFLDLACEAPAVICCRCSPIQKAHMVQLMKEYTGKRTLAIGDGGNDVNMIQTADVGVGIVGKEGKQASLAADFSITQFQYLQVCLWSVFIYMLMCFLLLRRFSFLFPRFHNPFQLVHFLV